MNEDTQAIPILVGVLGHRNLPDADKIIAQLKTAVNQLVRNYQDSPIYILTDLQPGAGHLAVEMAQELGLRYVAVVAPATNATSDPTEQQRIAAAKQKAHLVFNLPDNPTGQPNLSAGCTILQYAHIVLSVWDGHWNDSRVAQLMTQAIKTGLDQDIIYQLEGAYPSPIDSVTTAIIRRIPLGERSLENVIQSGKVDETDQLKFTDLKFTGKNQSKVNFGLGKVDRRILKYFERLNHDIKKTGVRCNYDTYPNAPWLGQNDDSDLIFKKFALIDHLANHFQKSWKNRFLVFMVVLGAVLAALHQIITHISKLYQWLPGLEQWFDKIPLGSLKTGKFWPILVYILLILFASVCGMIAKSKAWQQRYLDYRTIAEACRVQHFWFQAGIQSPVTHFFLRKQQGELEWIRAVLKVWYLDAKIRGACVANPTSDHAINIKRNWIKDQFDYAKGKTQQMAAKENAIKPIAALLAFTLLLPIAARLFFNTEAPLPLSIPSNSWININLTINDAIELFSAFAIGALVIIGSYRYLFLPRELVKSYQRTANLFYDSGKFFTTDDGIDQQERRLLRELGREVLAEQGDWLLLNRKRKLDPATMKLKMKVVASEE